MVRNMKTPSTRGVRRKTAYHHGDLAHAALAVALILVEQRGPDGFTLAEVAARLGVSATALYRHFTDRDALLVSVTIESFRLFEKQLRDVGDGPPQVLLRAMTEGYLEFAFRYPARYGLMFGQTVRGKKKDAALDRAANESFAVLTETLRGALPGRSKAEVIAKGKQVWGLCHGLASLHLTGALEPAETQELAWNGVSTLVPR